MNMKKRLESKTITETDLFELLAPGNRIFFSSGAVTPTASLSAIIKTFHNNLQDLEFVQMVLMPEFFPGDDHVFGKYRIKSFILGENISRQYSSQNVDFIPTSLSQLPYLFMSGAVETDAAIIQVTPPDRNGMVSLGPVNDVTRVIIENSPLVVAEINSQVPWTFGDSRVSLDEFDYYLFRDMPLQAHNFSAPDQQMLAIGKNTAFLVEDGSTLSMGPGRIFNAIASRLEEREKLGIVSHIGSDWLMTMMESGVLDSTSMFNKKGAVAVTSILGSHELYRYVDRNSRVAVLPLMNARYQRELGHINKLTSIINVNRIDITGDAVVVPSAEYQLGGFDSKLNISLAASKATGGKSIIVMKSRDGKDRSNINIALSDDPGIIRSTLGTTSHVVTEFGIASVFGKPVRERAQALIDIAHPDDREGLVQEAQEKGILDRSQVYMIPAQASYPDELIEIKQFRENTLLLFRPVKPSDSHMMRRLFYRIGEDDLQLRFLSSVKIMSQKKMQAYVNVDYMQSLSLVGIALLNNVERIVAECRYAYDDNEGTWEMAFVVDQAYQGKGVGRYMVNRIIEVARLKNIPRLTAWVHTSNNKMIDLLEQLPLPHDVAYEDDQRKFTFYLDESGDIHYSPGPF